MTPAHTHSSSTSIVRHGSRRPTSARRREGRRSPYAESMSVDSQPAPRKSPLARLAPLGSDSSLGGRSPDDRHSSVERALPFLCGSAKARLFVAGIWRRGVAHALGFATMVVRTIHAFTEDPPPGKRRARRTRRVAFSCGTAMGVRTVWGLPRAVALSHFRRSVGRAPLTACAGSGERLEIGTPQCLCTPLTTGLSKLEIEPSAVGCPRATISSVIPARRTARALGCWCGSCV